MPISDATLRTVTRQTENGPESYSYNPAVEAEVKAAPEWATAITTVDKMSRTIKCDSKKCENQTTFDPQSAEAVVALPDWVRTYRMVTLGNGARFGYCSDVCEVEGVTTGDHNVPEPKQVQEATGADMQRVIEQAKQVEKLKTKPSKKR